MPTEPRKVTVACPSCSVKIRITVKPEHEGKRVEVTCRCGQQIRTRLPERPKADVQEFLRKIGADGLVDLNKFRVG